MVNDQTVMKFGTHKGKKIGELPTDYLKWGAKELHKKPSWLPGFVHKTWGEIFAEELARRGVTPPIVTPAPLLPVETERGVQPWDLTDADELPNLPVSEHLGPALVRIPRDLKMKVRRQAIDNVSILLLKEFILRKNKLQGITEFAEELAAEVLKYGTDERMLNTTTGDLVYMGLWFRFEFKDHKDIYLMDIMKPSDLEKEARKRREGTSPEDDMGELDQVVTDHIEDMEKRAFKIPMKVDASWGNDWEEALS